MFWTLFYFWNIKKHQDPTTWKEISWDIRSGLLPSFPFRLFSATFLCPVLHSSSVPPGLFWTIKGSWWNESIWNENKHCWFQSCLSPPWWIIVLRDNSSALKTCVVVKSLCGVGANHSLAFTNKQGKCFSIQWFSITWTPLFGHYNQW